MYSEGRSLEELSNWCKSDPRYREKGRKLGGRVLDYHSGRFSKPTRETSTQRLSEDFNVSQDRVL